MKCTVKEITASSRISFKQITGPNTDAFYTMEFTMTKNVPQIDGIDLEEEKKLLWTEVHNEVDKQVMEVRNMYKKR